MTNEVETKTSQLPDLDFATLAPKTWREWRDRLPESHEDAKLLAMLRFACRTDFVGHSLDYETPGNDNFFLRFRKALNAELEDRERSVWRKLHWMTTVAEKFLPELEKQAESSRYRGKRIDDLFALGPVDYLVGGLIPAGQAFLLYGPRKAGKTFITLDMALCVATGRDWHGRKVKQGKVLHTIGEGNLGATGSRVKAWIEVNGKDADERAALLAEIRKNWLYVGQGVPLDQPEALAEFLRAHPGEWSLVVVDPLLRSMSGDTNAQKDMSAFIAAFDWIRQTTGAAVLIVHHSGKDETKGPLGSIALEAAVDGAARFTKDGLRHTLQVTLMRDAPDNVPPLVFDRESVAIDPEGGIESAALRLAASKVGLLEAIQGTDNPTADSLAASMGVDRATVFRRLKAARNAGLVDGDRIKLTPKGLETL